MDQVSFRVKSFPQVRPVLLNREFAAPSLVALAPEFIKRWNRFGRSAGRSRRVDETYIKVRGEWTYLYREVDKTGQTVDFRFSRTRDVAAAKAFFKKAIRHEGRPPQTITLDGYAASHRAVREMREEGLLPNWTWLRSSKYLNNLIEQDHRGIKSQNWTHAWLQELRISRHHHRWDRTASAYLQGTVHLGSIPIQRPSCAVWNAVLAK
jgi:transposase-like protein